MRLKVLFIFLLFFLINQSAKAQLSTKHYIPPITTEDKIGNQFIYISTPKNRNIQFIITPVGGTPINGVVSNGNPFRFDIANTGRRNFEANNSQLHMLPRLTSVVTNNKGYIIEAEDVIYVSVRIRQAIDTLFPVINRGFHAGAIVSKGLSGLGTQFRVGGFVREAAISAHLTFVSVMATENNTTVTFDDIEPGATIINYTGTFPITQTLNEGESYIVAIGGRIGSGSGEPNDLIGALVKSDKPIVVNSGSATGTFTDQNSFPGRDYGLDQIVDFSKVGNEYIFVRGDGIFFSTGQQWENVLIIAHEDNTSVFVNDNPTAETVLNAGEYVVIEGDGINSNGNGYNAEGNLYVRTSKNVFAYQGVGGDPGDAPNQGLFFVPPLSCENRGNVDNIASINRIGVEDFPGGVTIVTNKGATISIFEDGIQRTINPVDGPFDVDGNPNYVTYKLSNLSGNVTVRSDQELYCAYFNRNGSATSGSFYSGFPSPPEINFNTTVATLGNCIPNITLEALNIDLFDSIEWFFDDGSGSISTINNALSITPTQAGSYKLVGTINCSGTTFESQTVTVSFCPDDLDNDLIIDNVDVDLDNDGISNCDESRGNVVLDLTDTDTPILNFLDGSTDNAFIAPTLTQTNPATSSISGDASGNFTTSLDASLSNALRYALGFTQPSNIEFTQSSTASTIPPVDGETFSLTIGPSEKNITLLDPDNTLLVDTDFDGIFEAGVDNFSAPEIRFIFNPTPSGSTPFRFVASEVDRVTFRHSSSNALASSTFSGNLRLTCFALDSDNDNIPNSLDADSDNDGIPDLVEGSGNIVILSGNDSNLDGLDDVFTSGPITPVDSDGDGILNYLDLDSDNDGVYDIFEAGHSASDVNLDGRIDNAINLVGANGLVDDLETAPDNFTLAYTVSNLDSDAFLSYIDLDSDGDGCFDVIEAGYIDGDNDNIIGTSPIQVDAEGKVINIPDGYTVPNADYSIGAPIIITPPFTDVAFCEDSTPTITIDATADTFQWEVSTDGGLNWLNIVDDATYSGATTASLQISNLPLSLNSNQYRVFLQSAGNSCNGRSNAITLTVEPSPIVVPAVELRQCDDDGDGLTSFNLNEVVSDISTNYMGETFEFYPTLADAENGTNIILNTTTFVNRVPTTDIVWARAISSFGCYRISEVTLTVDVPIINTPFTDVTFCEDSTSTITIDATADTFQWEVSTDGGLNWLNIVDDATYSGATTASLQISNLPLSLNSNQYRVFLQSAGNSCNGTSNAITLTVERLPIIAPAVELRQCDDDGDGVTSFNLDEVRSDISTNYKLETFEFYPTLADAENGTNIILNTTTFVNRVPTTDIVWARAISNFGCYRISEVTLTVSTTAITSPGSGLDRIFTECDDFRDPITGQDNANNDNTDGITSFDFSSVTAEIIQSFIPSQRPQLVVAYYKTETDALAEQNAITNPANYRNVGSPNTQQIYVRVDNQLNNDCVALVPLITLNVTPIPEATPVADLQLCDDENDGVFDNGIVQTFNLESQTLLILGTQDPSNFRVTYHKTQSDANTGFNAITTTTMYENETPYLQTIYVRVTNIAEGCFASNTSFNLIVEPLPVANPAGPVEVCDDDSDGSAQNGISQSIPIRAMTEADILGAQSPAQFTVSYHATRQNALDGVLPLNDVISNQGLTSNIVYVRVLNSITQCTNSISQFEVIVHSEPPLAPTIANYQDCDNNSNGIFRDGIINNINLSTKISEILSGLDASKFRVTFHDSAQGAINNDNSIPSNQPYENITPYRQTVYVRAENINTGCVSDDKLTFHIVINDPPIFELETPKILCLGKTITLEPINERANYDYEWFLPDGTSQFGRTLDITSGGIYRLVGRASNGDEGANGQPCNFQQTVEVVESQPPTITEENVTIVDDSDNNSITIDTTNLGSGDYEYALRDEEGVQTPFQDAPLFQNLVGGFYTIIVRDKNGCSQGELDVSIIEFPKFFTPNNDGVNDTWSIKGASSTFYSNSQIIIFNRFGKIIAKIKIHNPGWNGTFNGKPLPSDDYWFSIKLIPKDLTKPTKIKKGNFSLLRR